MTVPVFCWSGMGDDVSSNNPAFFNHTDASWLALLIEGSRVDREVSAIDPPPGWVRIVPDMVVDDGETGRWKVAVIGEEDAGDS